MLLLWAALCLAAGPAAAAPECSFTADCGALARCRDIQDASCVCLHGECTVSGGWIRGTECQGYTDCDCRDDEASCFCKHGFCSSERWECHQSADCPKMEKCQGKNCTCSGDLCEWQCDTSLDCASHHCNRTPGYSCRCEQNLCEFERRAPECSDLAGCVATGRCRRDEACECQAGVCGAPRWVRPEGDCRTDRDCEATVARCRGGRCRCAHKDWSPSRRESRGQCTPSCTSRMWSTWTRRRPTLEQLTPTSVRVSWPGLLDNPDCAVGMLVKQSRPASIFNWRSSYKVSDPLPANATSYVVQDLVPDREYRYEVIAQFDKEVLGGHFTHTAVFTTRSGRGLMDYIAEILARLSLGITAATI